jgi:hypothetical protein
MNSKYPSFDQLETNRRPEPTPPEEGIKINGLEQVVQMLRHADPAFRQSMLKRIHARNPQLAQQILRVLR